MALFRKRLLRLRWGLCWLRRCYGWRLWRRLPDVVAGLTLLGLRGTILWSDGRVQ